MSEQEKLDEARYFFDKLKETESNYLQTKYNLSAVLSSARSVLQYAEKEAKTKSGGRAWYQQSVAGKPVVSFLRGMRNINIHENPLSPTKDVTIYVGTATSFGTASFTDLPGASASPARESPARAVHHYWFPDWTSSEDVISLCNKYLSEINIIVKDGVAKGFLSG